MSMFVVGLNFVYYILKSCIIFEVKDLFSAGRSA
jgi:hypothetical protein